MDEGYNVIQYVIPENSKVAFDILSHARDIIVKLLKGISDMNINNREVSLQLHQEFPIPIWECLCPRLKAKAASDFLVQGSHYGSVSKQERDGEDTLFRVVDSGDSYSFVVGKDIQLQIYPIQSAKDVARITIKITRGTCEISGYKLSHNVAYALTPYSPTLVKSCNDEPYSVYVQGLDRKVKLSTLDEDYEMHTKAVREHIFARCFSTKTIKRINPTILVLGPKNVGKTSFCQLLVNDAFKKKFSPLYIDLNIQRNLALPGTVSLTEVKGRAADSNNLTVVNGKKDPKSLEFEYSSQQMLHFGSAVFHPVNLRYYYFLIRKLGWMLSFHRRQNTKNSIAIIDTAGSQMENSAAIERILKSFSINLAVVIGDFNYYEKLKDSVLSTVPSEFIPELETIEPKNDYYDSKYYQYRIRKYFYGPAAKPSTLNVSKVRFNCFTIYKISVSGSGRQADDEKPSDYSIERIACNPRVTDRLLAVSAAKSTEFLSMADVKYYVCITDIDPATKTATVMAPRPETFTGGILLMGSVLMFNT